MTQPYRFQTAGYLNYPDYPYLKDGQYVRLIQSESYLPAEILGQIVVYPTNPARFVKFMTEFDECFLIMLCDGEGTSDAEIHLLDEMQFKLLTK